MGWLDQVLATPTVGLRLVPCYRSATEVAAALRTLVERLDSEPPLKLKTTGAWNLEIHTPKGFAYTFATDNLVVDFSYQGTIRNLPGRGPVLDPVAVRPYSVLFEEVKGALFESASLLVAAGQPVKARRFGAVAAANLDPSAPPPGVDRLLAQLSAPWGAGQLVGITGSLTVRVPGQENDRCRLTLNVGSRDEPETKEARLELVLDYGRYLPTPLDMANEREAQKETSEFFQVALTYFEMVGAKGIES